MLQRIGLDLKASARLDIAVTPFVSVRLWLRGIEHEPERAYTRRGCRWVKARQGNRAAAGTGSLSTALHLVTVSFFPLSLRTICPIFSIRIIVDVAQRVFRVTGKFSHLERNWLEFQTKSKFPGKELLAQSGSSVHPWANTLVPGLNYIWTNMATPKLTIWISRNKG